MAFAFELGGEIFERRRWWVRRTLGLLLVDCRQSKGSKDPELLIIVGCRCSVGTGYGISHEDGDAPLRDDLHRWDLRCRGADVA